jgi:CSLREA domain-containing protein
MSFASLRPRVALLVCLGAAALAAHARAATFTVNSTGDAGDALLDGVCATGGGVCTLRAAIEEANNTGILDNIHFSIGGGGVQTIGVGASLFATRPVNIDGTTQPGFAGTPLIVLNGCASATVFDINGASSSGSTIRSLVIHGCNGAAIRLVGSSNNVVAGNYVGTNQAGTAAVANAVGVFVGFSGTATNNRIGGTAVADRNVISGNTVDGIQIFDSGATANLVQGNYIGLNAAGNAAIPNGSQGVAIFSNSANNVIGGTVAGAGNVISGNDGVGVRIESSGATGNLVQRNYIGTNAAGTARIPNGGHGVEILSGANGNTIGGVPANGNVISGNTGNGVNILGTGTTGNSIVGNIIGLDLNGDAILENGAFGVAVAQDADGNIIGSSTGRNVISGNDGAGVRIVDNGTDNNLVQSNFIGVDITGALPRPNMSDGVILDTGGAASGNTIGGVGLGNVISGNGAAGIRIRNGMTGTLVVDNIVGRDSADSNGVPNGGGGVRIEDSSGNTIGGTGADEGNVIAGNNGGDGVAITGSVSGNAVLGNSIFSNTGLGIDLGDDGVTTNDIGDGDTGPNGLQNFPVLSAAVTDGSSNVHIAGSLSTDSGIATYRVEFFAGTSPDPSGFGEARRYLGFADVTTDGSGNAVIGVTLSASVSAGTDYVTATVTDAANNTSEFGAHYTAVGDLIVTTTADVVDGTTTSVAALIADTGADERISLREAIEATNVTGGTDTIRFGIPLTDSGHVYYPDDAVASSFPAPTPTSLADAEISDFDADYPAGFARSWYRIQPSSVMTTITDSVTIDAETQPGFFTGAPVIELDGSAGGGNTGLRLTSGPGRVRGFVIHGFTNQGLALQGAVSGYTVTGNYIGTDVSGTVGIGGGSQGIFISEIGGAPSVIGGNTAARRNVISANGSRGIFLWAFGGIGINSQIQIQGNYIGTDVTGAVGLGNQNVGVYAEFTGGHWIGGPNPGEGNVISGNTSRGIELNGANSGAGVGSDNNVIENNLIGTDASGTSALGNGERAIIGYAIAAGDSTSNNTIRGNVIAASANGWDGIFLQGNTDGNLLENNFIGTDATGTVDLGNTGSGILIRTSGGGEIPTGNVVRNNVIRFNDLDGVRIEGTGASATLTQNAIWSNGGLGIDLADDGVTLNDGGDGDAGPNSLLNFPVLTLITESAGTLSIDYDLDLLPGTYRIEFFKNPTEIDPTLHGEGELFVGSTVVAHPGGLQSYNHMLAGVVNDLVATTATLCTDGASCLAPSDTSELSRVQGVTTDVELVTFEATAGNAAVELRWQTASELNNLGFHLYRSAGEVGELERVTDRLIPGLGSSPSGAEYSYRDLGLANGVTYFYFLEDVETTGRTERRGPVSATPSADATPAQSQASREDGDTEARLTYGDPDQNTLRIVPRRNGVVLELEIRGFVAIAREDGTVRLEVPGLEEVAGSSVPVVRAWVDAVAGRDVKLASIRARELERFDGLTPGAELVSELEASAQGTLRARLLRRGRRQVRREGVKLLDVAYQGETKKALVELSPFAWDGSGLVLAKRLEAHVAFRGREASAKRVRGAKGKAAVRLVTTQRGLYAISLDEVLGRRRARRALEMRLSRQGEDVAYHVEGGALYFWSDGAAANPYGTEAVYELELGVSGVRMGDAVSGGGSFYWDDVDKEENHYYQAGLVSAPDLWLWELLMAPERKSFTFDVHELVSASEPSILEVRLQGTSDFAGVEDHHVRAYVNGVLVADDRWDGKTPRTITAELGAGVLREGANELELDNVGDTAVLHSMVMLDRFRIRYPRSMSVLENKSFVVDITDALPRWVAPGTGFDDARRYFAVDEAHRPELRSVPQSSLRTPLRADYLVIGPEALLDASKPLLRHRRRQGLRVEAVSTETVASELGHGELTPESIRELIAWAYHEGRGPKLRYVLLLGDATYDYKDHLGTGVENQLPPFMVQTSYLWTASDPAYAAINGDDLLPDVAIGRLPAKTIDELSAMVDKILAFENGELEALQPFVLVADNADTAGNFERDAEEIASTLLDGRDVQRIYLGKLGVSATQDAIVASFDAGASTVSYLGHGGIHLWADENVFNASIVDRLSSQPQQPLLLTMNCLNGYFHFPYFDSLAEALLKPKDKGVIAAFSPSGLSLNAPAHQYHKALMRELLDGGHVRLGDAILAAQARYAETGAFPELLSIYHLFGDPALTRWVTDR